MPNSSKYDIDLLSNHLRALGLKRGDHVLVRASTKKLGPVVDPPQSLIKALLDVIGQEGTLLGLAFTKTFIFPRLHTDYIFDGKNPCETGGFAAAMLDWPGSVRSLHPTNSFVAIGALAKKLLYQHDERVGCFAPLEKLIKSQGKMMLIGCIWESPGFSTVHLAQSHLGLSRKSLLGPLTGVLYKRNNRVHCFTKTDIPGCSKGFGKLYKDYENAGLLRSGKIGDADAFLIDATEAYNLEYELISSNPKYPLCDQPDCLFCRATLLYNKQDMAGFWLRKLKSFAKRALGM